MLLQRIKQITKSDNEDEYEEEPMEIDEILESVSWPIEKLFLIKMMNFSKISFNYEFIKLESFNF